MVSAIAASVGVIVALFYYTSNLKMTRLSNSAKMVIDLVNTFNSTEMRSHRRELASALQGNKPIDLLRDAPVLEFFEEIGYMTRRGVLDAGMVWNSFSWWLEPYYLSAKSSIDQARRQAQSRVFFSETEWLYDRMCRVAEKEEGKKYIPRSDEALSRFLAQESQLDSTRALPPSP
jgi:hypothetical protein